MSLAGKTLSSELEAWSCVLSYLLVFGVSTNRTIRSVSDVGCCLLGSGNLYSFHGGQKGGLFSKQSTSKQLGISSRWNRKKSGSSRDHATKRSSTMVAMYTETINFQPKCNCHERRPVSVFSNHQSSSKEPATAKL